MPKPIVEYYWTPKRTTKVVMNKPVVEHEVNVRIKASNGLIVGQITQGFRDKRDARRGVNALCTALGFQNDSDEGATDVIDYLVAEKYVVEKGPGANPSRVK